MKITKEMVNSYADKLLIGLTDEENKLVLDDFKSIQDSISLINDIKLDGVEPMVYCLDEVYGELREDEVVDSLSIEDILANSDSIEDREIVVPKVVGGDN